MAEFKIVKPNQGFRVVDPETLDRPSLPRQIATGVDQFGRSVAQGATLGFADEISAGLGAATGVGGEFGDFSGNLEMQRGIDEQIPAGIAIPGQILGAMATGTGLGRAGASLLGAAKPTLRSLLLRGAGEGAVLGGAFGAGEAEGGLSERLQGAGTGAALGAAGGAAGGALARTLTRGAQKAPTAEQLRRASQRAFRQAETAGVRLPQAGFANTVDDTAAILTKEGFNARLHPRIAVALDEMGKLRGGRPTLQQAENLRRVVSNAGQSTDASERRLASIMIGEIDDFVETVPGTGPLAEARRLWKQLRRGETIDELIDRARTQSSQFSGSGFENALRTQFRSLALNARKMRGFSAAEQAAIRRVAEGGPAENVLRLVGKLAPTGVISGAISGGAGFALGGPVGAVGLPLAGLGARQGATAMTLRNARLASELARQGGLPPANQLSPLLRQLVRGAAVSGPQIEQ